jgi:UDP-N-acetylmuramoyl-tripeptide--D-alanyl-D-alanine ligase
MTISELYERYLQYPSVQTDTRKIQVGDLFFALKGEHFDGNQFAAQALELGAAYAIVDDPAAILNERCLLTSDVLQTLQQLARHHRMKLKAPVIAITGSNGKTTTKELVVTVLSAQYRTSATEGNLNNHIGVPLTLLKVKPDAEMVVVEMGANHIGEIASYCVIAQPDFGLITNCGKAHLEGFGSLEGVKQAKGELYVHLRQNNGTIFRNADLSYLQEMAAGIEQQITYGSANAQVIGRAVGDDAQLKVAVLTSGMETEIQTQLVGNYNLPNVLAALTVGRHFNIDIDTMKQAIESYTPTNSRSQWIERGSNKIILDAYNANPSSMKLALENMARLDANNKWLLLGAMKEMGQDSLSEHQALADLAAQLGFKNVVLTGAEFSDVQHSFLWFADAAAVAEYLEQSPIKDSTILIKGSRGARMERVLDAL